MVDPGGAGVDVMNARSGRAGEGLCGDAPGGLSRGGRRAGAGGSEDVWIRPVLRGGLCVPTSYIVRLTIPLRVLLRHSLKGGFGECGNVADLDADRRLWAALACRWSGTVAGPNQPAAAPQHVARSPLQSFRDADSVSHISKIIRRIGQAKV